MCRGRTEQNLLDDRLQTSQSTSFTFRFQLKWTQMNLSAHGNTRWRRLSSLVPSQYGIVLYQSYNVPQQRKSSLSPFSAPVVRNCFWHHLLNKPALMPPTQPKPIQIDPLIHWCWIGNQFTVGLFVRHPAWKGNTHNHGLDHFWFCTWRISWMLNWFMRWKRRSAVKGLWSRFLSFARLNKQQSVTKERPILVYLI